MEEKIFRVPSECRNLIPYFWGLKHAACDELKQNGINEEPAQTHLDVLQKICDQNPLGSLANYVRELKKGFHMEQAELVAYDQEVKELQTPPLPDNNAPLDADTNKEDEEDAPLNFDSDEEDDEFYEEDSMMLESEEDDSWLHDFTDA